MLVRYVSVYGRFYGERSERQKGVSISDPFLNVQHLEWSERGTIIRPTRNVSGQYGPGNIPEN